MCCGVTGATHGRERQTNVTRPSGDDPSTFAKGPRDGHLLLLLVPLVTRSIALSAAASGASSRPPAQRRRPHSIRDLPDYLREAVAWHQTYYVPKVLPAVYHFHQRTRSFGSGFAGTPTLLVDVMLEYMNLTDEALAHNLGQILQRRPRTAWSWVEEVFNRPAAFVDERVKPTAMVLEFPMPD